MSNGGGQWKDFGGYWDGTNSTMYTQIYVYAWVAGAYSVAKNFWTDEARTAAVTSRQGGNDGRVGGYFHGDYNIEIRASDNTTVLEQIPNVHLSRGQSFTLDFGTALPSAITNAKGQGFAVINGSGILTDVSINQGTVWASIFSGTSGGEQSFTSVITNGMPVHNVRHSDYGALADGSDDTARVQLAIDAISTAGWGVLYLPKGSYTINGTLDINNCNIMIIGDGAGQTRLLQNSSPSGPMMDYDTNDILDVFFIKDILIEAGIGSVTPGDNCIEVTFPADGTHNYPTNFYMHRVVIQPTNATKTTSGFDLALILTDAKKPIIADSEFRSHSGGTLAGEGVRLLSNCNTIKIENCIFQYLDLGIHMGGSTDELYVTDCLMQDMRQNIDIKPSGVNVGFRDCRLTSNDVGIGTSGGASAAKIDISDCRITKVATSASNWRGITLDATDYTISGNTIIDAGSSSGTDLGISIITGTDGVIEGNLIKDIRTDGIRIAANQSNFIINDNRINTSVNGINVLAGTSDNYVITGNNLEGCTTPIVDGGTGTDKIIDNNNPVSLGAIVAASTVTGPTYTNFWDMTGTTTINTFTSSWIGRIVNIRAAQSVTVNHLGGNVRLAGSVAYNMTAGDLLVVMWDGTDWAEISRTVA